jgi:predicted nucleic acid-binding Zn ribbon protein
LHDDDDTTDDCPHCGASIYDDAEQCPKCRMYLSREDAPALQGRSWWFVALAILCLVVALGWVLRRW